MTIKHTETSKEIDGSKWTLLTDDFKEGLSLGMAIGGAITGILGGIGLGLAFIVFFIGAAYKLLTANIW